MKISKPIGTLVLVVLAMGLLYRALHPQTLTELDLAAKGLGQVLAEQAVAAIHGNGRVALIYMSAGGTQDNAMLTAFKKGIGSQKNVTLIDIKSIRPGETAMGSLTFNQFAGILNQYSGADVIVLNLGITSLSAGQINSLPAPIPKLVVTDWKPDDAKRAMEAGWVKAAISPRHLSSLPTEKCVTPRQWFDNYYILTTQ